MTRIRSRFGIVALALAVLFPLIASAQTPATQPPLLLRNPSLSQDKIVFRYADDIWTVSRQGGLAERLTAVGAVTDGPYFSPDGSQIAYTARLHGGRDVYVIAASGGIPRRITWHPGGSFVAGWSPDGKSVLINSGAASHRHYVRLFTVHADGAMPEIMTLIDMKPLNYPTRFGIDPTETHGTASAELAFKVPMLKDVKVDAVGISVKAAVSDFGVLLGSHTRLTNGAVNFEIDNNHLH